ncbi:hypothetical protein A1O3_07552 [Capronia epimyces CBS 606.96]|uniref:Uncharacterized protein n=1 Tax=Capronia epimyces CBS 606.96 TaxID=1182542 RepID=W9XL50_9EURO|nr:uncharacterized protein A1O3_07552 [Capronia epimyces CBS 606.96]EXJ81262.1 hypothetical protein A1O3_07552 [Capronia epimyces CBS 606.96]
MAVQATTLSFITDSSLDTDGSTSPDESTDIETEAAAEAETDETYFESRKGWNGPAGMKGAESKGFYGDVVQDYKAIARDVEAALVGGSDLPPSTDINVVSTTVNKKDKENVPVIYGGPELVPSDDELWG